MREKLNSVLQKEKDLFNKKNDGLMNLINAFDDTSVNSDGRFEVLKVVIESHINDLKLLFEKHHALQNQVNDLQDLVIEISKNQQI